MDRVPEEVFESIPGALWQPVMWAYCEGRPILFLVMTATPGPLILRTWPSTITAAVYFTIGWLIFRALGAWDPHGFKVLRRARRYRGSRTATIFARPSWRSPAVRFIPRRH